MLSYAGLRGAMGLILALMVANEKKPNEHVSEDDMDYMKDLILFFTAMIALLSIIINGNTTGILIKKLGLTKVASPLKTKL